MMTKEEIDYIKTNKRFKRTYQEYVEYILCVFMFPITICFLGFYKFTKFINLKLFKDIELLLSSIILNSIGIFIAFFFFKRLKQNETFEVIKNRNNLTLEEIEESVESEFKLTYITAILKHKTIIMATETSFFSWGEKITIIIDQNNILINSRTHIGGGFLVPQVITITKDRKNIKKLRQLFS